jgi:hypothetical protein
MTGFIVVELGYAVAVALLFLAAYGPPKRWSDPAMGWHIAAFTMAVTALVVLLLLAMLGVRIPAWLGALVVGCLDAALTWRLVLAVKARRGS